MKNHPMFAFKYWNKIQTEARIPKVLSAVVSLRFQSWKSENNLILLKIWHFNFITSRTWKGISLTIWLILKCNLRTSNVVSRVCGVQGAKTKTGSQENLTSKKKPPAALGRRTLLLYEIWDFRIFFYYFSVKNKWN